MPCTHPTHPCAALPRSTPLPMALLPNLPCSPWRPSSDVTSSVKTRMLSPQGCSRFLRVLTARLASCHVGLCTHPPWCSSPTRPRPGDTGLPDSSVHHQGPGTWWILDTCLLWESSFHFKNSERKAGVGARFCHLLISRSGQILQVQLLGCKGDHSPCPPF